MEVCPVDAIEEVAGGRRSTPADCALDVGAVGESFGSPVDCADVRQPAPHDSSATVRAVE
jgi:hypothetical protein